MGEVWRHLEDKLREPDGPKIVGGEANARSAEWDIVDRRRRMSGPERWLPGYGKTTPDITLASAAIVRYILDW